MRFKGKQANRRNGLQKKPKFVQTQNQPQLSTQDQVTGEEYLPGYNSKNTQIRCN